jgi:lipopolysaccharide biosynthesis protein
LEVGFNELEKYTHLKPTSKVAALPVYPFEHLYCKNEERKKLDFLALKRLLEW